MTALDLLPYQQTGAAWLCGDSRRGLGDEMGIGKSAQAIRAMDEAGVERAIVVAPAGAHRVGVWKNEHAKFARVKRRLLKPRDVNDLNLWLRGRADVLLLSYELATKWSKHLQGDLFDALICDEAHYLKNHQAARTRAILGANCDGAHGLARWAARVWPLSGTFGPNDPTDYWPWLRFLRATPLTNAAFKARYFKPRTGTFSVSYTPREEYLEELRAVIRSVILRRTAKDVGLDLPPIWTTTREIDGDSAEIQAFLRQWPGLSEEIVEALEKGGLSFLDSQHVATLRRLIGEAKAPAYVEMVAEELQNGLDKIVIMGLHVDCLQMVRRELTARGFKGVQVVGGTSDTQSEEAVRAFNNDADCRFFIGNIFSAGTALTLTAANHLDLLEQWWSPAANAQALKRVHRISQTRAVRARLISLAGSLDETVAAILERKISALLKVEG